MDRTRQQRWYERHGCVVDATALFVHGCGPIEVTMVRTYGTYHRNTQDNPPPPAEPCENMQQTLAALLGNVYSMPNVYPQMMGDERTRPSS